jgi:hypothetical protein
MRGCCTFLIVVGLGLIFSGAKGQMSIGEFIGSAIDDPEVKTFTNQISYLGEKPYRLSPLQSMQLRMQNRELLYDQQEFALRINPANPWEVRNNNRYFKSYRNFMSREREVILKEALVTRYQNAIVFAYLAALKSQTDSSQFHLDQQLRILEKQYASSYFDADEYVKLKVEHLDNLVEVEEVDYDLAGQRHMISRLFPKAHNATIMWNLADLISIDKVERVVDSMSSVGAISSFVAYQQEKIRVAKSEYDLEKSNINIGFLQTEFDQRRVKQDRTPINISFGVTIPIVNPNKGDMAKKKLDLIEAEYDLEEATFEGETDKLILQDRLRGLIHRYRNLKARIIDLEKNNFAQTLSTIKGGDPLIVAQFNQRVGRLKDLMIEIQRDVLLTYIDYLAFTDNIQQQPFVNFLSPRLEAIQK